MYTIGEFSRITGLTVKALRFYHEEGLLVPASVDPRTGYRYYDDRNAERARAIALLRRLEFPVDEIRAVLQAAEQDDALLDAMERHKRTLEARIGRFRQAVRSIDAFLTEERQAKAMANNPTNGVQEKDVPPILIAGVRMRGHYSECGKGFARIGRALARFISGKPMLLHYDDEYRDEDADFEACMPVKPLKKDPPDGIAVRDLPAARVVTLLHRGPYDEMGRSYAAVFKYVKAKGYKPITPTREVYLKGPGMIFKGNPKKYVTDIQIPVDTESA